MSNFKVIKCPKCDAALVEIDGTKVEKCIQCGFDFGISETKVPKTSKLENYNSKKQTYKQSKATLIKPKSKLSIVITIIKWYFIIAFILGLISTLLYTI